MRAVNMKKAAILAPGLVAIVAACTPTVRVQAPTEPITINLNVKVEQEIRVKLEREVEDLIASNPDIF